MTVLDYNSNKIILKYKQHKSAFGITYSVHYFYTYLQQPTKTRKTINKNRTYPAKFLHFQRRGAILTTSKVQRLESTKITILVFDVLLTVHLGIFILVINQLDAQNLFYNKFISCLYMFRAHVLIIRRSKLY